MGLSFHDTTTIVCLGTSVTETLSDRNGYIDKGTLKSVFTTSVTTATSSISSKSPNINVRLDATRDYVSSMSIQEIDKMLVEIDEYEQQILNAVENTEKVKTIGTKTKF